MSSASSYLCCCLRKPWQWLKGVCCQSANVYNPYLGEYELQRVLALIGYLATCKQDTGVSPSKVAEAIQCPGADENSERDWKKTANSHPEFFSVEGKSELLRLWSRFFQSDDPKDQVESPADPSHTASPNPDAAGDTVAEAKKGKKPNRSALKPDRILQLQETAMKLHSAAVNLSSHELERRSMWVSAIFGLLGGVLAALVTCWLKGN